MPRVAIDKTRPSDRRACGTARHPLTLQQELSGQNCVVTNNSSSHLVERLGVDVWSQDICPYVRTLKAVSSSGADMQSEMQQLGAPFPTPTEDPTNRRNYQLGTTPGAHTQSRQAAVTALSPWWDTTRRTVLSFACAGRANTPLRHVNRPGSSLACRVQTSPAGGRLIRLHPFQPSSIGWMPVLQRGGASTRRPVNSASCISLIMPTHTGDIAVVKHTPQIGNRRLLSPYVSSGYR